MGAMASSARKRMERRAEAASRPPTVNVSIARPKRDDPFFGFTMPRTAGRDLDSLQFIYLIGAEDGLLKIGVTNDLERRLCDFSRGSPVPLRIVASRTVERVVAFQVERRLHAHFVDRSRGGEWFAVTAAEVLPVMDRLNRRARSALRYFKLLNGFPVA